MSFDYHKLTPERFQQLCQALLLKDFPSMQCFPVGMPDGGRDGAVGLFDDYYYEKGKNNKIVLQVKLVKNPDKITNVFEYLKGIVDGEVEKILKLQGSGCEKYILITNLQGTSHYETGTIDKIKKYIDGVIPIETLCLWKDDLDRRLETSTSIRWMYPEILNGNAAFEMLLGKYLNNDERLENTIIAFLEQQYHQDKEVRFKQSELYNDLYDLFIDIPISRRYQERKGGRYFYPNEYYRDENNKVTAVKWLLSEEMQSINKSIVVEGAPGQGKSTISQFLCQVFRGLILSKPDMPNGIDISDISCLQLPIKADLRDFAAWLNGNNPFFPNKEVVRSASGNLERFLCSLIEGTSGVSAISVSDLHKICKLSNVLLLLDGFDEVADVSTRNMLVKEVTEGTRRLKAVSSGFTTIVTSRPSAFSLSEGFNAKEFSYIRLDNLSKSEVFEYANKWIKAKRLNDRDKSDLLRILKEKIDIPYMRELTKNPMQLAILLNLIHLKGGALPEKITSLYENYIDLFLDRESEKSIIVKNNRDLILDLHGHIAWIINIQSENGIGNGSLSHEELKNEISEYLEKEERGGELTDELLSATTERVVFLVSRHLGYFEFEVQPLREFFVARHLFESAPASKVGAESNSSKPDRFNALIRNFYWFNVARFYAGFYSKGELLSATNSIEELILDGEYSLISHPYLLTSTLLSDWIFAQNRKATKEAIGIITKGIQRRYSLFEEGVGFFNRSKLTLPKEHGQDQLVEECVNLINNNNNLDFCLDLMSIISSNRTRDELMNIFLENWNLSKDPVHVDKWINLGYRTGILSFLAIDQLHEVYGCSTRSSKILEICYLKSVDRLLELENEKQHEIIKLIADGEIETVPIRDFDNEYNSLMNSLNLHFYLYVFDKREPVPLEIKATEHFHFHSRSMFNENEIEAKSSHLINIYRPIIDTFNILITKSCQEWAEKYEVWNAMLISIQHTLGAKWLVYRMANLALATSNWSTIGEGNTNQSIIELGFTIKTSLRVGHLQKLYDFINHSDSSIRNFALAVILSWSTNKFILNHLDELQYHIDKISEKDWRQIHECIKDIERTRRRKDRKILLNDIIQVIGRLNIRMSMVLLGRSTKDSGHYLVENKLMHYSGNDKDITEYILYSILDIYNYSLDYSILLPIATNLVKNGAAIHPEVSAFFEWRLTSIFERNDIPIEIARKILHNAEVYPRRLIVFADKRLRNEIGRSTTPISEIARKNHWFE